MIISLLLAVLAASSLPGVGLPCEARLVGYTGLAADVRVRFAVSADLDGDGIDEFVSGVKTGLLFRSWRDGSSFSDFQYLLPPRFLVPGARAELGAACDVDGDGWREVLLTANTADGWEQRLLAIDPRRDEPVLDVALPTGPDVRADGTWDGHHRVLGVTGEGDHPVAYLSRIVSYDRRTRGIVAYDLRTGAQLWFRPTANIVNRGCTADLDGDGVPELVVGLGASNNQRAGDEVDGRLDDVSWVMALREDGSLLWEVRLAPYFADVWPVVCDLDGDGRPEVAVVNQRTSGGAASRLYVLDGTTGRELAATEVSGVPRNLAAWRDEVRGEGAMVVGSDDNSLTRYDWNGAGITVTRTRTCPAPVFSVDAADVLPEPGPELYVVLADHAVQVYSGGLDHLADLPPGTGRSYDLSVWSLGDESVAVYTNELNAGMQLVRVPAVRRYARPAAGGVLLLALAGAAGTTLRQRRRLGRLRRTSRRDLLRAFLTARHGTVGPVGACERVMWSLDNPAPGQEGRPAEVWAACRAEAVPDLEALLEKAAHIRLDPPLLAVVRRELANLVRVFDELVPLPSDDRRRARLQRAARTSLGLVADGVKSLGATLAASCRLEPLPVVRDLVARHAARRPHVAFRLEPVPAALPPCHADAADLEFALDNLLDNAGRFAEGDAPAVTVRLQADRDRLRIHVRGHGSGRAAGGAGTGVRTGGIHQERRRRRRAVALAAGPALLRGGSHPGRGAGVRRPVHHPAAFRPGLTGVGCRGRHSVLAKSLGACDFLPGRTIGGQFGRHQAWMR